MNSYYLMTMTVPIPAEDKMVVIRNGKKVEYETERTYVGNRSTRVKRKVIGKVDPVQAGRMFPNEAYFELFPENEVPEEIRNEFLRECAIKRQMKVIRQNPEEVIDGVVRGLGVMNSELNSKGSLRFGRDDKGDGRDDKGVESEEWRMERNYAMMRRVFDEIYYAVEELAGKFPNEVVVPFKVERINEVLSSLRDSIEDEKMKPFLRLIEEGLTYSDVLLMLKWYKVLPR